MDGWLYVSCCGGQGSAVFQYDTNWPLDKSAYQIYWQKQPGTLNDTLDVTWKDGDGHTYTATSSLSEDRVIFLSPGGITLTSGKPAKASLPSLSLG
jgi:hypothetical protein